MDIPVPLKGFENRNLTVRAAGLFTDPKLFVDGSLVKPSGRRYHLRNNEGHEIELKIKYYLFDPIPKIWVDGNIITLVPRLKLVEYAWLGFVAVLFFFGGIVGIFCAFWAIYFNFRVFRSRLPILAKFLITGVISALAIVAYLYLGTKATLFLRKYDRRIMVP
ncbi:MAG: hypothetical protein AMJ95_00920 [Omnitrophica WOR_2 bacterium SM23_72]|nr:MAG: hypothetical protein AMJ95_00920 [Omnitrophica WOR_2 bacterium SM23_72]